MRRRVVALALAAAAAAAPLGGARADPGWTHAYLPGDESAGRAAVCAAIVRFSDAAFAVRLTADGLDFFFQQDALRAAVAAPRGGAAFDFRDRDFILRAAAATTGRFDGGARTDVLVITPEAAEARAVLEALRSAATFRLALSSGRVFEIGLDGSGAAIDAALRCWARRFHQGRRDAPLG